MHFQAGTSYFDQGRYEDAIREWREAYRLSSRSVLLVNIATAEERVLRFDEAIATLEEYLRVGGAEAEENRATIETRIQNLRELASRVQADTGEPPPDQPPPDQPPPDQPPPDQQEPEPQGRHRVWSWVMLGTTGALAIVPIITGAMAAGRYGDLEEQCPNNVCPTGAGLEDTRDSGDSLALVTDVFIGLAAASAVATVLLFIFEGRNSGDSGQATLIPTFGPGQAGLHLRF